MNETPFREILENPRRKNEKKKNLNIKMLSKTRASAYSVLLTFCLAIWIFSLKVNLMNIYTYIYIGCVTENAKNWLMCRAALNIQTCNCFYISIRSHRILLLKLVVFLSKIKISMLPDFSADLFVVFFFLFNSPLRMC